MWKSSYIWKHQLIGCIAFRNLHPSETSRNYISVPLKMRIGHLKTELDPKAFPLLECLHLVTKQGRGGGQTDAPVVHRSLKEVNLSGFSRIWEQLEFVKFLLGVCC